MATSNETCANTSVFLCSVGRGFRYSALIATNFNTANRLLSINGKFRCVVFCIIINYFKSVCSVRVVFEIFMPKI